MFRRCRAVLILAMLLALSPSCVEQEREVGQKPVKAVEEKPRAQGLTVSEIVGNAAAFQGREVIISGEALPGLAFEFIDEQPYTLDDGTGRIWVITTGVMPAEGSRVTVRGTVRAPYQIKGRRFEVAVLESGRDGP